MSDRELLSKNREIQDFLEKHPELMPELLAKMFEVLDLRMSVLDGYYGVTIDVWEPYKE